MGLLLSVLVACVGVVELLAFYSNVTRNFVTTSTRTNLSDLSKRYIEDFTRHKKSVRQRVSNHIDGDEAFNNEKTNRSGHIVFSTETEVGSAQIITSEPQSPTSKESFLIEKEIRTSRSRTESPCRLVISNGTNNEEKQDKLPVTVGHSFKDGPSQESLLIKDDACKDESEGEGKEDLFNFTAKEQDSFREGASQECFLIKDKASTDESEIEETKNLSSFTVKEQDSFKEGPQQESFLIKDDINKDECEVEKRKDLLNFTVKNQDTFKKDYCLIKDGVIKDESEVEQKKDLPNFIANEQDSFKNGLPHKCLVIKDEGIKNQAIVQEKKYSFEKEAPQKCFLIINEICKEESAINLHNITVQEEDPFREETSQKPFLIKDEESKDELFIVTERELEVSKDEKRSRSPSPIPKRLGELDVDSRRSPSPYPPLVLPVPRNSFCSELLDNPTLSVVEVDEELLTKTSTLKNGDQILETNTNTTDSSTNYLLVPPTRSRSHSPECRINSDPSASNSTSESKSESDFVVTVTTEPTPQLPNVDEEGLKYDERFLDSLDGVKKKKISRNSTSRKSRKVKFSVESTDSNARKENCLPSSSMQNNDAQTAKTLTEAANVLKTVNREADGPSGKAGAGKDGDSKNGEPFWLIFSGEYTKAMNKDWHGQHFCCWQCDESLTGQRYVLRDEHPYCVSCYESVFANACEKCSRIIGIDSKDLSYKDKHWHEACFLCTTCGESLVDRQFGSKGDRIYCGRCYDEQFASRCDGCHEIFRAGTKKMEYKTRQWHEKCFCCFVCKVPIGTQSFIPREQEIYCAKCYEEKFATRCIKCNKVITSGGVTYKNEPWHRECFTCTHCTKSLAGERFTSRDEKPYCAECFGELFAKRCFACNKPITGIGGTKFISFEDRHWHNDCFFCASCRTSLVGRGFITDQDDIICPECAKQKLM